MNKQAKILKDENSILNNETKTLHFQLKNLKNYIDLKLLKNLISVLQIETKTFHLQIEALKKEKESLKDKFVINKFLFFFYIPPISFLFLLSK